MDKKIDELFDDVHKIVDKLWKDGDMPDEEYHETIGALVKAEIRMVDADKKYDKKHGRARARG